MQSALFYDVKFWVVMILSVFDQLTKPAPLAGSGQPASSSSGGTAEAASALAAFGTSLL